MRVLVQQYIQAYALPITFFLIILCIALRLSGFKSFARTGWVVAGVILLIASAFGGYPSKVSATFFGVGIFSVVVFGYLLYSDPEARRRR